MKEVAGYFRWLCERENKPCGKVARYDAALYEHQIPGGMISNMRHQLKIVGMEHKMERGSPVADADAILRAAKFGESLLEPSDVLAQAANPPAANRVQHIGFLSLAQPGRINRNKIRRAVCGFMFKIG
jgi:hypothetical protein